MYAWSDFDLRLDLLSKAAQGLGWGAARPAGRAAEEWTGEARSGDALAGAHQSPMAMRSEHSDAKVFRTGTHRIVPLHIEWIFLPNHLPGRDIYASVFS